MKYAAKALSLNATIAADVSDRRVMLDTIGPHGVETRARGHKQCTRTQWGLTATHTGFRSQRERRRFAQTGKAKFVHTTNTTHGATSFAPRLFYYFFCDVASRTSKSVHVNKIASSKLQTYWLPPYTAPAVLATRWTNDGSARRQTNAADSHLIRRAQQSNATKDPVLRLVELARDLGDENKVQVRAARVLVARAIVGDAQCSSLRLAECLGHSRHVQYRRGREQLLRLGLDQ